MALTWDSLALLEVCAGVVALGVVLKHQQAFGPQLQRHGAFQSCLQPDHTSPRHWYAGTLLVHATSHAAIYNDGTLPFLNVFG